MSLNFAALKQKAAQARGEYSSAASTLFKGLAAKASTARGLPAEVSSAPDRGSAASGAPSAEAVAAEESVLALAAGFHLRAGTSIAEVITASDGDGGMIGGLGCDQYSISWFRSYVNPEDGTPAEFQEITGLSTGFYNPSIDDVDCRILCKVQSIYDASCAVYAQCGPLRPDPTVEARSTRCQHAGSFKAKVRAELDDGAKPCVLAMHQDGWLCLLGQDSDSEAADESWLRSDSQAVEPDDESFALVPWKYEECPSGAALASLEAIATVQLMPESPQTLQILGGTEPLVIHMLDTRDRDVLAACARSWAAQSSAPEQAASPAAQEEQESSPLPASVSPTKLESAVAASGPAGTDADSPRSSHSSNAGTIGVDSAQLDELQQQLEQLKQQLAESTSQRKAAQAAASAAKQRQQELHSENRAYQTQLADCQAALSAAERERDTARARETAAETAQEAATCKAEQSEAARQRAETQRDEAQAHAREAAAELATAQAELAHASKASSEHAAAAAKLASEAKVAQTALATAQTSLADTQNEAAALQKQLRELMQQADTLRSQREESKATCARADAALAALRADTSKLQAQLSQCTSELEEATTELATARQAQAALTEAQAVVATQDSAMRDMRAELQAATHSATAARSQAEASRAERNSWRSKYDSLKQGIVRAVGADLLASGDHVKALRSLLVERDQAKARVQELQQQLAARTAGAAMASGGATVVLGGTAAGVTGDLQRLVASLTEELQDRDVALAQQRKTKEILAARIADLEAKLSGSTA